jgi:uncharacterized membrane protein HdeD (DUF308 family)
MTDIRPTTSVTPDPAAPVTTAPSASPFLAQSWWALALRGGLAILFGVVALAAPAAAILSILLVFAAYVFVDGVLGVVAAARAARRNERWGWLFLEGAANILMAFVVAILPLVAAITFVLVLAAWAFVTGALMLAAAYRMDREQGRFWLALSGGASILFALALVVAPLLGLVVLTWWIGLYAVVFGVGLVMLGRRLNRRGTAPTPA